MQAMQDSTPGESDALPTGISFGLKLRALRKRLKLSQRQVAAHTVVDESTIARIESGTRKPPRDVAFYDRLREIPGLTEDDYNDLIGTDNAPRWLDHNPKAALATQAARTALVSVGGLHVASQVYADPDVASETDLGVVAKILQAYQPLMLEEFLAHRHAIQLAVRAPQPGPEAAHDAATSRPGQDEIEAARAVAQRDYRRKRGN